MWLNEGVTQVMEDIVVDASEFLASPEWAREHRDYWNATTIQRSGPEIRCHHPMKVKPQFSLGADSVS